ncbi:N-acetylmuramidase domain-containing protein [Burkholderia arboris]|uniref:N-acetylmuramidase domain-containing protein n=1 Tax=Burkholderia arboris TaxID=488730 RepID=UPI0030F20844
MADADQTKANAAKAARAPLVEATFLFRDVLRKPIEGLSVQLKVGNGTPPAPAWQTGPDPEAVEETVPVSSGPATAAADGAASPAAASTASGTQAPPAASPAPADTPKSEKTAPPPVSNNAFEGTTDKDGHAATITNVARNQPIDVFVKNQRGEYVWKVQVTPSKDISSFTIVSPEYHIEATTQLTPKDELEQNLNLPAVKVGEVMTIERLFHEFGPYISWTNKVTEQGRVQKDHPTRDKETVEDKKTHKKKTKIKITHHLKVVDTGKPHTVAFSVFGTRLNYPTPETFSEAQFQHMATELNVEIAAIKAIVEQESHGHPYIENGLPPILYERRHFYALAVAKKQDEEDRANEEAQKKIDAAASQQDKTKKQKKKVPKKPKKKAAATNPYPNYPELCFPNGKDDYSGDTLHQYEKLMRAANLDFEIALKACSWGGFQIMGESYKSCGCSTIFEFVNKFFSGTNGQMEIFILFMKNEKKEGVDGLREHKWEKVAESYNGSGWRTHNPDYAKNLQAYYEKFK